MSYFLKLRTNSKTSLLHDAGTTSNVTIFRRRFRSSGVISFAKKIFTIIRFNRNQKPNSINSCEAEFQGCARFGNRMLFQTARIFIVKLWTVPKNRKADWSRRLTRNESYDRALIYRSALYIIIIAKKCVCERESDRGRLMFHVNQRLTIQCANLWLRVKMLINRRGLRGYQIFSSTTKKKSGKSKFGAKRIIWVREKWLARQSARCRELTFPTLKSRHAHTYILHDKRTTSVLITEWSKNANN